MVKTFEDAKELILGTRFKKLGDIFLDDVANIYKKLDIDFETTWFSIFFTLDKYGKLTMGEIATNLGVTQSAISQTISIMEKKNLIEIKIARQDKRIKVVSLTDNAHELISKIKPVWKSIQKEMRNMLNEGDKSRYMLDALKELECSFNKKSLTQRVLEYMQNINYRIEKYKQQHLTECKRLIFSWIFEYGSPYFDFIQNLKHILQENEVYLSFSNEHITAMAIILTKNNKKELFIINKNDYEEGSYLFLLQNILNNQYRIYADRKKTNVQKILKEKGYQYKRSINFSDTSKELAIFEVYNG